MKRWTYFLFAVVALAVIGGAGYWGYRSQQTAVPLTPPAPVTIAVTQGDVQQTVTAPGQLVGTQQQMLGLDVRGRLIELNVRPGTAVPAGDVIARIDPTPYQNALNMAQIELAQAQAALTQQVAEAELAADTSGQVLGCAGPAPAAPDSAHLRFRSAEIRWNVGRQLMLCLYSKFIF